MMLFGNDMFFSEHLRSIPVGSSNSIVNVLFQDEKREETKRDAARFEVPAVRLRDSRPGRIIRCSGAGPANPTAPAEPATGRAFIPFSKLDGPWLKPITPFQEASYALSGV